MRIVGLDVGEKRIGVARADEKTRIAVPIGYINVDGLEWQRIARIAKIQGTDYFVLGLPRSNEGNETKQSEYVRNFARILKQQIPEAKIRFQDESLTSVIAEERLKSRKRTYEKGEIDAEAAAIILQDFLESYSVKAATLRTPDASEYRTEVRAEAEVSAEVGSGAEAGIASEAAPVQSPAAAEKGKNGKKKSKKWVKIVSIIAVVVILGLVGTGVGLILKKEEDRRAYAEWVAEQEAKMAETFTFTIRPGETIYDVKEGLIAAGYSESEAETALSEDYDFDFLNKRPTGASLEGYLYGETYEFYEGTPATEVVRKFLEGMATVISENNLEAKFSEQGLTLHEGIILASIVQKEAHAEDMPTVAQVFLSRLEYGMALGSDVTVSYALDTVDPDRITYNDNGEAVSVDSCYNTRLYRGLPCGAISNPGISALLAVANPSDTSYLYFLTGDDGLMYYSYTEDEHLQNVAEHCQELCAVSL